MMRKKIIIFVSVIIAMTVGSVSADLNDWQAQAAGTSGNVVADNTGYVFDGTAGIAYDYGNLGDDEVGSVEYIFNLSDNATSIALGQVNGWGSENMTYKLEQWSDLGVYGVGLDGYWDKTFPGVSSTFDADVHVVFVGTSAGIELYVNGVSKGLDDRGAAWWNQGGLGMLGSNSGGNDVPVGTIYGVGTYAAELTPAEVAALYDAYIKSGGAPALISPDNKDIDVIRTPRLEWWAPEIYDAAGYRVYLDPNEAEVALGAASVLESDQGPDPNYYDVTPALEYGETYYWMVEAEKLPVTTPPYDPNWIPSSVASFTTAFHLAQLEPGIDVENYSFELPGTGKIRGWDGNHIDYLGRDIPGWSSDTPAADSGVETGGGTHGSYHGFLMGGDTPLAADPPAWNLTDYPIATGDKIDLVFSGNGTYASTVKATLYYDNAGARVPVASQSYALNGWQDYTLAFDASTVPASVGKKIGVEFENDAPAGDNNWAWIDNVRLLNLRMAYDPDPDDGDVQVPVDPTMSWQAGVNPDNMDQIDPAITGHNIYLDPNMAGVQAADDSDTSGIFRGFQALGLETYSPTLDGDTTYYWRIDEKLSTGDVVKGAVWTFDSVKLFPIITNEPNSLTIKELDTARFEIEVSSASAVSYQWYTSDGTPMTGKTAPLLEIPNATAVTHEDYYYCRVSNAAIPSPDGIYSAPARLMFQRLVAHWEFENSMADSEETWDGEFVDPNEFEPPPTPAYQGGIVGTEAFEFPQDGKYILIPDSNDYYNFYPQGYTVNAWVKTTKTSGWGAIAAKQDVDGDYLGWVLNVNGNSGVSVLREQSVGNFYPDYGGSTTVTDGEWHMVTGQFDHVDRVVRCYIDGELENTSGQAPDVISPNVNPLILGVETRNGDTDFEGLVDDVKIWNYPRTRLQIAQEYIDVMGGTICLSDDGTAGPMDFNDDCIVNLKDLAEFAAKWLECYIVPDCY